jgi:hypothetical protein
MSEGYTVSDNIVMYGSRGGVGCTQPYQMGLPQHCPPPRTERGKRRHEARSDTAKRHAEGVWGAVRSVKPPKKGKGRSPKQKAA